MSGSTTHHVVGGSVGKLVIARAAVSPHRKPVALPQRIRRIKGITSMQHLPPKFLINRGGSSVTTGQQDKQRHERHLSSRGWCGDRAGGSVEGRAPPQSKGEVQRRLGSWHCSRACEVLNCHLPLPATCPMFASPSPEVIYGSPDPPVGCFQEVEAFGR